MPIINIAPNNPNYVNPWESFTFGFLDFEVMPDIRSYYVESPVFTCHGTNWKVKLYPRGKTDHVSQDETSLYLCNESQKDVNVDFEFFAKDSEGRVFRRKVFFNESFAARGSSSSDCKGQECFASRNGIFGFIGSHGTLVIELRMRTKDLQKHQNFIPKNKFSEDMVKLAMINKNTDATFVVGQGISSEMIHAHHHVLKACAPNLASLCEDCDKNKNVHIYDVDPAIFKLLLRYMYCGNIPECNWESNSKEILEIADKYGIITLKIEAEARYVDYFHFTVENVCDTLLCADERNFALLKEAAMKFITENASALIASDSFQKISHAENVIGEIFAVLACNEHGVPQAILNGNTNYKSMPVNDLRRNLYEKGLDIDGSREMLIARLEEKSNKKKRKSSV